MRSVVAIAGLGLVTTTLWSCSPTAPPPPPTCAAHISGPATVPPGGTAQFTLTANYSDGTTKDVTASAIWSSSNQAALTIAAGLASGLQPGETTITASLLSCFNHQTSVGVMIVPAGTFRLIGQVRESGFAVPNATVQVTAGTGSGLTTSSDASGNFRLYGVAGMIQVTASKAGYTPTTVSTPVFTNASVAIDLSPSVPEPSLAGTYTLTLAADPACPTSGANALPDFARTRSYTATISQQGPSLTVVLSGASFVMSPQTTNTFSGREAPDGITFTLVQTDYYFYSTAVIEERVSDNQFYLPGGTIVASRVGADIVGTLNGTIVVNATSPKITVGQCDSAHHSVTFINQTNTAARARIRRW